jgi:serine/threonine protein kinase
MALSENDTCENKNPNTGRQTPIAGRRPLQRIAFNTTVLSPTKRRKQNHNEEVPALDLSPLKCTTPGKEKDDNVQALARSDMQPGNLLCEIFSRLSAKDIVDLAAPVCRLWRDEAHSKELWAILRKHMRLVDQLLVMEKVVERRSKGKLFKCKRLGTSDQVLLRVVNLELTNAGKDDGVPTSFLREAALLSKVQHPNIIRYFGSEILGREAVMCTEFVLETFTQWHKRLEVKASTERLIDLRVKYRQLLVGVSFVHHQGIMHRNLKPDNIFLDQHGLVKLGDFTTTRMLDIPFMSYTPEDPKERERSGREMRRLWYRAPELILRDEIYGPKVDTWSVGCLLAEAATGKALFQSDSEIDHLFRTFRLIGTPNVNSWPEALMMKNFSPKFPIYPAMNFAQVARAVCCGSAVDLEGLKSQAAPDRMEILQNLMSVASVLGADGMLVLSRLLTCPPAWRAGADAALVSPFFSDRFGEDSNEPHALTSKWMHGDLSSAEMEQAPSTPRKRGGRERMDDTPGVVLPGDDFRTDQDGFPDVEIPTLDKLIPSRMVWSILDVMQRRESSDRLSGCCANSESSGLLPQLPTGFDSNQRSVMIDFMIGLASTLSLTDYTLHLASCVADRYISHQDGPVSNDQMRVIGATCLKVADVFAEQSKEYYKQENTVEYAEATMHQTSPAQMLSCEKDILPKVDFDLRLPTVHWFLQCYLAYANFASTGGVAKTAFFIGDLTLLDYDLLIYPASVRAQSALLLAGFLVQRSEKKGPSAEADSGTSTSEPADSRPSQSGSSATSETQLHLPNLEHWDECVRNAVCHKNTAVDTAMCVQAVVRTLVIMRREWKSAKLVAVETKHASNIRALNYPEMFPVSKLVRYLLPDGQRGLIPE